MVNAEFSRIYRFVKLLVNEGFLAVLYNFDNFTRRRMSDHNKITFTIKYLLMSPLG